MRRSYAKNSLKNIMSKLQIFPRKIQKDLILDLQVMYIEQGTNNNVFGSLVLIIS